MTVAELIEKLQKFPQDLPVGIPGQGMSDGAWVSPTSIKQTLLSYDDNRNEYCDPDSFDEKKIVVAFDCDF